MELFGGEESAEGVKELLPCVEPIVELGRARSRLESGVLEL